MKNSFIRVRKESFQYIVQGWNFYHPSSHNFVCKLSCDTGSSLNKIAAILFAKMAPLCRECENAEFRVS
jgi:hypothetical protein